jgi:hypothetical protein
MFRCFVSFVCAALGVAFLSLGLMDEALRAQTGPGTGNPPPDCRGCASCSNVNPNDGSPAGTGEGGCSTATRNIGVCKKVGFWYDCHEVCGCTDKGLVNGSANEMKCECDYVTP